MPEAPIPTAAGNVSAHFSQRALLPTVATLLALGGSREVPLPGLFTSENEDPPLPSQAEILLRERTPAEVRERAKVAASKRQRRKAFLRLRKGRPPSDYAEQRVQRVGSTWRNTPGA
jgi:hypothetical protein